MLIGCGLRRPELLALQLESIQRREEHWVIADLVGKGGHVRTVPIPTWVKSAVDAWVAPAGIRHGAVVRAINKAGAPISDIASMEERVDRATSKYRFSGVMVGALAMLALVVAAIGTYAVIAFAVASRTREIGIRIALGATRGDVVGLVIGVGVRLVFAGSALGVAGAYAGSHVLSSLLLGVTPHDPATFVAVPVVLVVVALAGCYVPARHALSVDPVIALKTE